MNKIKKLFGEINMTWPKVIIFAVVTAVYTALINQVPFLKDTSFRDIAINFDCWILFAVIIITNCKKWWEAMLKCFVFFLVGQPLIYLIEVPFLGWGVFDYYKNWFIITLLTLPGAVICYQLKRRDWLSLAVLSVANGYLAYMSITYFRSAMTDFPKHLLSSIFCLALAVLFTLVFFDKKNIRIVSFVFIVVVMAVTFVYTQSNRSEEISLGAGDWSYSISDGTVAEVEIDENGNAKIKAKGKGGTSLIFKSADGTEEEYYVTVTGGGIYVSKF